MLKIGLVSKTPIDIEGRLITNKERSLPSIQNKGLFVETCSILMEDADWRTPITIFLSSPLKPLNRRTRIFVTWFILLDGELFKKGIEDDTILRCLGKSDAMGVIAEIHEGIIGAH